MSTNANTERVNEDFQAITKKMEGNKEFTQKLFEGSVLLQTLLTQMGLPQEIVLKHLAHWSIKHGVDYRTLTIDQLRDFATDFMLNMILDGDNTRVA